MFLRIAHPLVPTPAHPGTTEPPVYVDEVRAAPPPRLEQHERMRIRTAAFRATRAYPGPVGELISRELLAAEEFGYRMVNTALVTRLVDDVMRPES